MAAQRGKAEAKSYPKLKWWNDAHTRRLALQSQVSLDSRRNQVALCVRNNNGASGAAGGAGGDRFDRFTTLLLEDASEELSRALDARLSIREVTTDAYIEFHIPKSLYLARVEPALSKVHNGLSKHKHVGPWTIDHYETSIKYLLESLEPLKELFGDVFGPRKWGSGPAKSYNDDPAKGPLRGGVTSLRVCQGYPLVVQV